MFHPGRSASVWEGLGSPRPSDTAKKQACAAVGQSLLMETWQAAFAPHGITVAQVLLTHEDLRARARHLGVKETLAQMSATGPSDHQRERRRERRRDQPFRGQRHPLGHGGEPGRRRVLLMLSTAPGLIDMKGTGRIVPVVERITPEIEAMAGGTSSETAVGGMVARSRQPRSPTKPAAGCSSPAAPSGTSSSGCSRDRGREPFLFPAASRLIQEELARLFPEALGDNQDQRLRRAGAEGGGPKPPGRGCHGLDGRFCTRGSSRHRGPRRRRRRPR